MITVELKEKEINDANAIIQKYKTIEASLIGIEKQLEILDKERESLLNRMSTVQKEEVKFFDKLKKKHGEGRLDLYTMKYVVTNESNSNLELDKKS